MTDIVERVRQFMLLSSRFGREVCQVAPCACAKSLVDLMSDERQAEIELLRAQIEGLQADKAAISETAAFYLHEVERLGGEV